jgi:hypothetical protein
MRLGTACLTVLAAFALAARLPAQGTGAPAITSPAVGQVLQGQVAIRGTSEVPNFASAELAFAYAGDQTNTWFVIQTTAQPVVNDVLAGWDTSTISDGDYVLRLRVTLQDGTLQEVTVPVRISNYTALPTPTPTVTPTQPALQIPTPILVAATATPTTPAISPPTPLPPNPAEITQAEIYRNLRRGALVIAAVFVAVAVLLRLRRS